MKQSKNKSVEAPKLFTPAEQREQTLCKAISMGHWSATAFAAQQFLVEFPQDGKCWHLLGVAMLQMQRTQEAEIALRKAVAFLPQDEEPWDHLGVALNRQYKLVEAEQAFALSIGLNAKRAESWSNAAKNANDLENYSISEKRAREALRLAGDHPSHLNNLACALNGLHRYEEAEACLRTALKLAPEDSNVRISLAATMSERAIQLSSDARQLEAVQQFKAGIAQNPTSIEGLSGYATSLLRLGQIGPSRQAYSHLLLELRKMRGLNYTRAGKPYMSTEKAAATLLDLKKSLQAANAPFFLIFGTLLGIYRGGDILPHDKDLDVGLFTDVPCQPLRAALEKEKVFAVHPLRPGEDPNAMWNMELCHRTTGVSVDLFFFRPDGNCLLSGFVQRPSPVMFRFPKFELANLSWRGEVWNVPNTPEMFLETMYGPNWRIPDPGFDGVLSSHCLEQASVPVSICYGIARLYDAIKTFNYPKALAYCRQILALQDDPIVREWADWLITTDQCRAIAAQGGAA